ncbi:hypothetical protein ITJ38_10045 [Agreia pratensis]|uniref:hypothetical protein n=1 Tax=Agreia pratensis TaxID=150121 RepID=UPI00188A2CCB|nr:hypothetical protein [Agreia pratensis]MBF4634741.1 hypothetical protein [Agreia pratensis]
MTDTPDWIIDAVPGAREALDHLARIKAEGSSLVPEEREASTALGKLGRWIGEAGENSPTRQFVPRQGVTRADFDAASAVLDAVKAKRAELSRSQRAPRARFESLLEAARRDGSLATIAARLAVERQAEAAAAWSTLVEALQVRDEATHATGVRLMPWEAEYLTGTGEIGLDAESRRRIEEVTNLRVQVALREARQAITPALATIGARVRGFDPEQLTEDRVALEDHA